MIKRLFYVYFVGLGELSTLDFRTCTWPKRSIFAMMSSWHCTVYLVKMRCTRVTGIGTVPT